MARKEAQIEEILCKHKEDIKEDVQKQIMSLNSALTDINTQLRDSPKVHFLFTMFGLAIGLIISPLAAIDYSSPSVFWLVTARSFVLGVAVILIALASLWISTNTKVLKQAKRRD